MTGTCAACLHTNQSRSYMNHLLQRPSYVEKRLSVRPYVRELALGFKFFWIGITFYKQETSDVPKISSLKAVIW